MATGLQRSNWSSARSLGWAPACHLRLPRADGLAAVHVRLWWRDGNLMLHDLSEGAAIVNGLQLDGLRWRTRTRSTSGRSLTNSLLRNTVFRRPNRIRSEPSQGAGRVGGGHLPSPLLRGRPLGLNAARVAETITSKGSNGAKHEVGIVSSAGLEADGSAPGRTALTVEPLVGDSAVSAATGTSTNG